MSPEATGQPCEAWTPHTAKAKTRKAKINRQMCFMSYNIAAAVLIML